MPREIKKLTGLSVSRASRPGLYSDGAGLYLQLSDFGTKSWVFRFRTGGRLREMGLGALHTVSLQEARRKAKEAREALDAGKDPITERDSRRATERAARAKSVTFKQAAETYITSHAAGWRNEKHGSQWRSTLAAYAYPVIGDLPVSEIDTNLILKILEPIWKTKTETASRLRGRIEVILDAAKVRGQRSGENPARWRGHLEALLPSRTKIQSVTHHSALPYAELGQFMAELRHQEGTAARALEYVILTACRTSEAIGAMWEEIDLANATWTIPADRIKSGREHRVPLSKAAVSLLRQMAKAKDGSGFVFLGGKRMRGLSNNALLALLKRMGRDDLTAHGFRSTFRDWAAEQTNFAREVAEAALAHIVNDKTEAAYRRGDLFEKRRRLMEAWATFAGTDKPKGEVVKLERLRKRK